MSPESIAAIICTSITAVAGLAGSFLAAWLGVRKARKAEMQEAQKEMEARHRQAEERHETVMGLLEEQRTALQRVEKHSDEQYLGILRLTIMAEGMPVSERIVAADKYLEAGGNGDVKKYVHEVLLPNHTK